MSFTQAVATCFKKYFVFAGRATRSEYWWFALFYLLATFVLTLLVFLLRSTIPIWLVLGLIIPTITVTVRRLHDTSRSGWYYWLSIIPLIGPLILLVFLCQGSAVGSNEYGPSSMAAPNTDPYLPSTA